jgi:hypothetical protein
MLEHGKTYVGGCLCGKVRYKVIGPSLFESQCCCKDCQKATGTGHTTIVGIHRSQLLVEGSPATYTNQGESGGSVTRHFCGNCGGRLYTSGTLPGEVVIIQAGSLDEPNAVTPAQVIFHKDAVKWDYFQPGLPIYDKYAPVSEANAAARKGNYDGPKVADI